MTELRYTVIQIIIIINGFKVAIIVEIAKIEITFPINVINRSQTSIDDPNVSAALSFMACISGFSNVS